MSLWTAIKNWTASPLSVADMQTYVSENTNYLKEQSDLCAKRHARVTTLTTVINTVAETALFTDTIVGNTLGTDGIYDLDAFGDLLNDTGVVHDITIRVRLGGLAGTVLFTATALNVNTSASRSAWQLHQRIIMAGATNAQRASGSLVLGGVADLNAVGVAPNRDAVGGGGGGLLLMGGLPFNAVHNASAVDMTANQDVVVTAQLGTPSLSMYVRLHGATAFVI
ncbi:MAG: hypothetical protein V4529_17155 [Gemmatimonadota bacterium]